MALKLVIFDLDGTLLNTLADLEAAVNSALALTGHPARSADEVRRFIGNGVKLLVQRALPEGYTEAELSETYRVFLQRYAELKFATTAPYPGIIDVLKYLKKKNVAIAVLSNKYDRAAKELCAEMLPLVDYTQGEEEGIPRKPDPAGVYAILRRFSCAATETVLVGDSEIDLQTAANAGVLAVAVSWGARTEAELALFHPAKVVANPAELKSYFCEFWGTDI